MEKLIAMLKKAYALAGQVVDDNRDEQVLQVLAEEVSGECGEFLALWDEDHGAFGDLDWVEKRFDELDIDPELIVLIKKLKGV